MTVVVRKNLWKCDFCKAEEERDSIPLNWGAIEIKRTNEVGEVVLLKRHSCQECSKLEMKISKFIIETKQVEDSVKPAGEGCLSNLGGKNE